MGSWPMGAISSAWSREPEASPKRKVERASISSAPPQGRPAQQQDKNGGSSRSGALCRVVAAPAFLGCWPSRSVVLPVAADVTAERSASPFAARPAALWKLSFDRKTIGRLFLRAEVKRTRGWHGLWHYRTGIPVPIGIKMDKVPICRWLERIPTPRPGRSRDARARAGAGGRAGGPPASRAPCRAAQKASTARRRWSRRPIDRGRRGTPGCGVALDRLRLCFKWKHERTTLPGRWSDCAPFTFGMPLLQVNQDCTYDATASLLHTPVFLLRTKRAGLISWHTF
jgi:hypothetical protein